MEIREFRYNYSFLSNFAKTPFVYKGRIWRTSEHAYQWEKAESQEDKNKIYEATTPNKAKTIGHKLKCNIQEWDARKVQVMEDILKHKFIGQLRQQLVSTGDAILIEGNYWHDNFWGKCNCNKCKDKNGENQLGQILMRIRSNYLH